MRNVYYAMLSLFRKNVLIFACIMIIPAITSFANADVVYPAESYTLSDDGLTLEMWKGSETDIDMNVDENLAKVKEIGNYAFEGKKLSSIVIGTKVEKLGNGAFFDCAGLKTVTFSGDVKTIGMACFSGCIMLDNIVIPKTVTEIGNSVFLQLHFIDENRNTGKRHRFV